MDHKDRIDTLERLQVIRKLFRVEPFHLDAFDEVVVLVSALAAGCYLNAAEKKIEASRVPWVIWVFKGIHRPL